MLRARQMWAGAATALPGLREALGLAEDGTAGPADVDAAEAPARALVEAMEDARLGRRTPRRRRPACSPSDAGRGRRGAGRSPPREVVPRLARTTDEIDHVLHALDGGYVPAGPSGSPLRGLVNVLPTGRNFYSVDPKAVPSRLAWETGQAMADSLLDRYRADNGELAALGRAVGVGHQRDAHRRRRHRRGAGAARRAARCGTRRRAG